MNIKKFKRELKELLVKHDVYIGVDIYKEEFIVVSLATKEFGREELLSTHPFIDASDLEEETE